MPGFTLREIALAIAIFVVLCVNFLDPQMLNFVLESFPTFW